MAGKKIMAEWVHVDGIDVPNVYGGHYRYSSQSFIRLDGRVYWAGGETAPHKSQIERAKVSDRASEVECELVPDAYSAVHTHIVASHGGGATTNDADIRKMATL